MSDCILCTKPAVIAPCGCNAAPADEVLVIVVDRVNTGVAYDLGRAFSTMQKRTATTLYVHRECARSADRLASLGQVVVGLLAVRAFTEETR